MRAPALRVAANEFDREPSMAIYLTEGSDQADFTSRTDELEIYALGGNDTVRGGKSSDYIDGGLGNDLIIDAGGVFNLLVGGAGDDGLILYDFITELSAGASYADGGEGNDILRGGFFADTLIGGSGDDVVTGDDGDDTIFSGRGRDSVGGEDGDDRIYIDNSLVDGVDTISGGEGDDVYVFSADPGDLAGFVFRSDPGVDRFEVAFGFSIQTIAVEDLQLTGASAINGRGNNGNNTVTGNGAANRLEGLNGADFVYGEGGADTLSGGAGVDWLQGGLGDDVYELFELARPDAASAAAYDGVFEYAGEGRDTIRVRSIYNPSVVGTDRYTLPADFENGEITGSLAFDLTGNAGHNLLVGNRAVNTLDGLAGKDTLVGGLGSDNYVLNDLNLYGPAGLGYFAYDEIQEGFNAGDDTVYVRALKNPDIPFSAGNYALGANIENGVVIGSLEFDLYGNGLNNTLRGNEYRNYLTGYAGADVFDGGGGSDTLAGGVGNDAYYLTSVSLNSTSPFGYFDFDFIVEAAGEGIDRVFVTAVDKPDTFLVVDSYTLADNIEICLLTGTLDYDLYGNVLGNTLTGNLARNSVSGYDGADNLDGGQGYDVLYGGFGDDTFFLNDLTFENGAYRYDLVVEAAGQGRDLIVLASLDNPGVAGVESYSLADGIENLTLTGSRALDAVGNAAANRMTGNSAANSLDGGDGADLLTGGGGADVLLGGGGADKLIGGAGQDVMTGGAGNDRFVFQTTADSTAAAPDRIFDFNEVHDRIDLREIDANTATVIDDAFHRVGALTGAAGEYIRVYNKATDATRFDFNLDSDSGIDFCLIVDGKVTDVGLLL
jgi:Ca2+-binding RTX toxin-like protein